MAKKQTRYGDYGYLRRRIWGPDGKYVDVYARTSGEVEDKIEAQKASNT